MTSRKLAFLLTWALIERSGRSRSGNPVTMLNTGSIETKLHRMMELDIARLASCALTFCTKNIRAWGRRHGAYQGVGYRCRREQLETIVPQLTIEEQVGCKHKLTNAGPLWRRL